MKRKIYEFISSVKQGLFALTLIIFSITANSQTTFTFSYTGSTQTISLPAGSYSIRCWGADGGNATNGTAPMTGGKGGFATGVLTATATTIFNVYVGGRGGNASGASNLGGGGGGMSDIAAASNPTAIIIAAGAGGGATSGGASEASTGGNGGGLVGGSAIDGSGVSTGTAATGGSQTAGGFAVNGSYGGGSPGGYGYGGGSANGTSNPASPSGTMHAGGGAGGNGGNGGWNGGGGGCTSTGGNDHAAGGGAGYYGGGGGRGDGGAGGGGSSYIGGVSSGSTSMFGQSGFVTNPDVVGHGRILITELCNITLNAAGPNGVSTIICSGQSLTLTTNAINNYSWSTGATTSSLVVSPTTNTVYSLSATSPSNCSASANISVTVSAGIPTVGITASSLQVCPSQSVILTATGATSYTWTGISNGVAFAPTTTSLYVVNASNGCGTSTAAITISVAPLPVTAVSTHTAICANRTATLMATAAATIYNWQPGAAFNGSIAIVSPSVNTIYTVTASDGTCSGTSTVSLNSYPIPTVAASPSVALICPGDATTLTATGGQNYTWSPSGSTLTSIVVSPTSSTSYTVTGDNSFGCSASYNPIVLVGQQPSLTLTSNNNIICAGQTVTLSVTGADNYSWNSGPSTSTYVVNPTQSTNYNVTGTLNASGCTATASISVNVFLPLMSISGNTTICAGKSTTLSASAPGAGINYTWSPGNQQGSNVVLSPSSNAVYSVSAISSSNSLNCPVAGTVMITVNANPTLSVVSPTAICVKESRVISASGASSYTWNLPGSGTSNSSSVNISSQTIAFLSYTVTGSNNDGCTDSKTGLVIANSCTGLENNSLEKASVLVYPNPSQGDVMIKAENKIQLTIVDELGRHIQELELNEENAYSAELNDLANGIYFVLSKDFQQSVKLKIVVAK